MVAAHQLRHSWHAEVRELCYRVADAILSREALHEPWLDTLTTERNTGLTTKKLLTDESRTGLGRIGDAGGVSLISDNERQRKSIPITN